MTGLLRDTLLAVLSLRRAIPIAIVCVALVVAQQAFSRGVGAMVVAIALCGAFLVSAPYLWRRLAPWHLRSTAESAGGLLLYGVAGALTVGLVAGFLPWVAGIQDSFLGEPEVMLAATSLYWVGGWGLGRDIELERRLEGERDRVRVLVRETQHTQILAIRRHLDPHFLFNTLNAIAEWCREDPATAERSILRLSALLRAMLDALERPTWTLAREVEIVGALFELHHMRDPDAFEATLDLPPELAEVEIPALILLPLAENAMKHGPRAAHHGPVFLRLLQESPSRIEIVLENPGPHHGPREGGKGLAVVRRRLDLTYDGRATLEIEGTPGPRTRVLLRIPMKGMT